MPPYNRSVPAHQQPRTWILTGSPENFEVTRELGLTVVGLKERRRNQALEMAPGDRIVYYLTRVMSFAASAIVTGELYEERTAVWPGKPGRADAYPWRRETEPELALEPEDWVPAQSLAVTLEHIRKWPPEHWKLAFQGQLRTISRHDSDLLMRRMRAAAPARA